MLPPLAAAEAGRSLLLCSLRGARAGRADSPPPRPGGKAAKRRFGQAGAAGGRFPFLQPRRAGLSRRAGRTERLGPPAPHPPTSPSPPEVGAGQGSGSGADFCLPDSLQRRVGVEEGSGRSSWLALQGEVRGGGTRRNPPPEPRADLLLPWPRVRGARGPARGRAQPRGAAERGCRGRRWRGRRSPEARREDGAGGGRGSEPGMRRRAAAAAPGVAPRFRR